MTLLRTAGVDEVGRGPLAGPVVAAAVILDPGQPIVGLADSKALTPARREALYDQIVERSLAWAIAEASVSEIDSLNILQASMLAMRRAVEMLTPAAEHALVDGNRDPGLACRATLVVGGDASEPAIGAASILAKVTRDREMHRLDVEYPDFGFAQHKGYPTRAHLAALKSLGVTPIHRRSFAPVRNLLGLSEQQVLL
ncbi:MAG: ribonuclease HII [Xanthomonadales bacterium]|nr:ribonuclease HII [Xanthomonadales bacterium]